MTMRYLIVNNHPLKRAVSRFHEQVIPLSPGKCVPDVSPVHLVHWEVQFYSGVEIDVHDEHLSFAFSPNSSKRV
jgi:hypothetical protein